MDGEIQGNSLAPVGSRPKVAETNDKETLTVFLAGLLDVRNTNVVPLPPTVVFSSKSQSAYSAVLSKTAAQDKNGKSRMGLQGVVSF